MGRPVIHWEIGATDAARLQGFYRELFDWDIASAGPEYYLVAGTPPGIGGGILQVPEHVPPYVSVYVQVDDLEESLGRAVRLGATELVGPTAIAGIGRFAMVADPEGHPIGLLQALAGDVAGGSVPA